MPPCAFTVANKREGSNEGRRSMRVAFNMVEMKPLVAQTSVRAVTMARQARARELQSRMRARRLQRINEGLELLLEAAEAQAVAEIDLRDQRRARLEAEYAPAHATPAPTPIATQITFPEIDLEPLAS